MAMPPGGGSSWHHSSDSHQLVGDDGAVWAAVNTPLGRGSLTLMFPSSHSRYDFFYLFALAAEQDGSAAFTYHHPLLPDGSRKLTWTAATPPGDLVPHPEVRQRGQFGRIADDAPVIATVLARPGGLTLIDAGGAARFHLQLGSQPDPAWPQAGPRGAVQRGDRTIATFCIPTGPGARVKTVAVSLP